LTAMFFARASRGRMAVGRLTAAILARAKRGEEPVIIQPHAAGKEQIFGVYQFSKNNALPCSA